ncbi:aldo/keto reductase [Aurantimonas sp. MSK8Z-1]|uniref:aldo/keto reductase n=1 Tax=Mangrovibrevibacter kandeliae TaxID=2968473 RepID=UPI0021178EDD|nr:aldo/keto reductase [Aurantimonas sp. MSK8Z-1]MCW4115220.1 aldo/keto reductase [Aurantimonas sp. MSK8Z-1]
MQYAELSDDHRISRVIRGNWQLAGGHGPVDRAGSIADLAAFADAGIVTFDCADIYTGVEEIIGEFRQAYRQERGQAALDRIRVHTKFVPDLDKLGQVTRQSVEAAIDVSLARLRTERLDLVQFHWWDYSVDGWLETAGWLGELRKAGKIRNVGGTNFDTPHVVAMCDAGVPLVSMQVQYSVLDTRPERQMVAAARERGFQLLCYGSVAGGFLSEKWLGVARPQMPLENRSLTKYALIIEEIGGWTVFQDLLAALRAVADRHGTDIATVASRWVLDRPGVAGVIVGARNRSHLASNLAIADLTLDAEDHRTIDAVRARMTMPPGKVYEIERDREGRHGSIMHYSLNSKVA